MTELADVGVPIILITALRASSSAPLLVVRVLEEPPVRSAETIPTNASSKNSKLSSAIEPQVEGFSPVPWLVNRNPEVNVLAIFSLLYSLEYPLEFYGSLLSVFCVGF